MRAFAASFLLGCTALHAQDCLPDGITFGDQAGIDAFTGAHPGCTTVLGTVTISGAGITNVDGLAGITDLPGGLFVHDCPALTDLSGLSSVSSVGFLNVRNCNALPDLTGLDAVTTINGYLSVQNNAQLQHLTGLGALTAISDFVMIRTNAALEDLAGLDAVLSVGGYVQVAENDALATLTGLGALTSVGDYLTVRNCAQLADLSALSAVTHVGSFVQASSLPLLTSLHGLEHIDPTPLANYNVFDCPQLTDCAVASLCGFMANGGGPSINGNGSGCATQFEVQDACTSLSVSEHAEPAFTLAPNPARGEVVLRVFDPAARQLRLVDGRGRIVRMQRLAAVPAQLRLDGLAAGTYLLELLDAERPLTRERLVVLP